MWRSRIVWRLFIAYSLLVAVALGSLGFFLVGRIENQLLAEVRQKLDIKSMLIRELVSRMSPAEWQAQMTRLGGETSARITLIDAGGKVLAESSQSPEELENHAERPEVKDAERSGVGVSTRFSASVHLPMMYLARRNDAGPVRYVRVALPLAAVHEEIGWLRRVVWTGTGITLALALGLSFLIARRLSAPLIEVAQAARSISQGRYGERVNVRSEDEIGALALAFNEMSQACAAHIAQMDQDRQQLLAVFRGMVEGVLVLDAEQNIQFFNDAAGRMLGAPLEALRGRKLWEVFRNRQLSAAVGKILASDQPHLTELEWSGAERRVLAVHGARLPGQPLRGAVLVFHDVTDLRKLERVRQEFVANVSHELKTPLAAIQALVETLLGGAVNDSEHAVRFLDRIRENADRLHRLILDLLTLGRIESGEETMEIQPLDVAEAMLGSITRHEERAKSKDLQLAAAEPREPVTVLADAEALAQILDNLVDNAIKYTPAGGKITLRWRAEGQHAILQVEDTGVGIPERDLSRIFERFYRVDKARSRELGGTGLGLSIVKHLVHALGGTVAAEGALGAGSVFSIRLPRTTAAPTEGTGAKSESNLHKTYTNRP
ncbi:MAG: ATP-binding protein [Gemmataceae bacterium]